MKAHAEPAAYEEEVEYDRLQSAVSWPRVEEYAGRLHAAASHPPGGSKLRHCHAVAELAGRHAEALFSGAGYFAQRYYGLVCRAAGMLHEAFDCGACFEDLVRAADEAAARLVAAVTPDRRSPRARRLRTYGNQIGLAPPAAQLVKLADLQHDCLLLRSGEVKPGLADWLEEAREAVSGLGRIPTDSGLDVQVRRLKADLRDLDGRLRPGGKR